jgi:hypothetical protein
MQKSHGKGFVSFLGGKTIDSPIGFKTSCQYLGMTKIFGVQNVLPKTFFRSTIANISTTSVIQHYKNTGDYLKFFNDFIGETDNGRSSTRIADAFDFMKKYR